MAPAPSHVGSGRTEPVAGANARPAVEADGRTGRECDLSTQCWHCGGAMREEHAHYRCTQCGQRDSCCDGPY